MLVMLLTLVLRILSGAQLNARFLAGFAVQASLALAWLAAAPVSRGPGSLILACLVGPVILSPKGPKASGVFAFVMVLSYGLTLWWADAKEGDIPLFMDWFDTLVTLVGAAILRAYLEHAAESGGVGLGASLGVIATLAAVVLAWIPSWSLYSTPLLLTSFVGLGALLTKNAQKRK